MIIRFAGFGGQGIAIILRVIACYDRKITGSFNSGHGHAIGVVTRCLEEARA